MVPIPFIIDSKEQDKKTNLARILTGRLDLSDFAEKTRLRLNVTDKLTIDFVCKLINCYLVCSLDAILNNQSREYRNKQVKLELERFTSMIYDDGASERISTYYHVFNKQLEENLNQIVEPILKQSKSLITNSNVVYKTYLFKPINDCKSVGDYLLTIIIDDVSDSETSDNFDIKTIEISAYEEINSFIIKLKEMGFHYKPLYVECIVRHLFDEAVRVNLQNKLTSDVREYIGTYREEINNEFIKIFARLIDKVNNEKDITYYSFNGRTIKLSVKKLF